MGYSSKKYHSQREGRPWKVHPVWRGIGCALCILIPIMSWYGSVLFMQNNRWVPLPADLTKPILIPYTKQAQVDQYIGVINNALGGSGINYGYLFFTVVIMFLGFGLLSIIYGAMYRVAGPPRYGPFDAPPEKVRRRRL
jgi:hypothetical protein